MGGLKKFSGYAVSMALLAIASLIVVPSLIRAGGAAAWGAIAAGQAVGALGAVLISYGWSIVGPSLIAKGSAQDRRNEFIASIQVRTALVIPVLIVVAGLSAIVSPQYIGLAAVGAVQAGVAGLSANWFFVGLGRPFVFLAAETLPRVLGSVVAIVVMNRGASALVGVLCQVAGMVAAFAIATTWILAHLRAHGAIPHPRAALRSVLGEHRHGVTAILGGTAYVSAPLILVSIFAPAAQPLYALVDKLQRQVAVGLSPAVTVVQGWVPAGGHARQRAPKAIKYGAATAAAGAVVMMVLSPYLARFMGAGALTVPLPMTILTGLFVGVYFLDGIVAKAVLSALGQVRLIAKATLISASIGLPLVVLGGYFFGAAGALGAVVLGLAVRVGLELRTAFATLRVDGDQPED